MKKLKTINLQGKKYVQVNERVKYFNETYKKGEIVTEVKIEGDTCYFKARICPDVTEENERFFNGHSFGKLGKEKALEKLETVAVGRALAFMGIGIVEGIASADEMQNFANQETGEVLDKDKEYSCDICHTVMVWNQQGTNLYCPNDYKSHKGRKGKPVEMPPKKPVSNFPEEDIEIEDLEADTVYRETK